jgi:hypothetical protein
VSLRDWLRQPSIPALPTGFGGNRADARMWCPFGCCGCPCAGSEPGNGGDPPPRPPPGPGFTFRARGTVKQHAEAP